MKRLYILILSAISFLSAYAGPMDINGTVTEVDTLVYKQVGPGVVYCHGFMPGITQEFHVLTIDLQNKYVDIETFLANDCVKGTELVTDACNRKTNENKDSYCGINADFFNVPDHHEYPLGAPRGGSIEDGVIQVQPRDLGWGYATIDENKKPLLDNMEFSGDVIIAENNTYTFKKVNIPYGTSNMTFYNRFAGAVTRPYENNGGFDTVRRTEVVIVPVHGYHWGVNKDVRVKVKRVVHNIDGGEPIAHDESVLSGVKDAAVFLDQLHTGDELTVRMNITTLDGRKPNIKNMVAGNALLLKNGELTNRNTNDGYNNTPYPRTAIGCSQDGRWVYLFVCDGKYMGGAPGLKTAEVAAILKHAGAYNVVGCDGGGSSEMVVSHAIVNRPADGHERAVGNGWLVASTAPADSLIASVRFLDHKLEIPRYASYRPVVLGYNKYGALIDNDVQGFTLSCDESIGTCAGDVFTAVSRKAEGKLTIDYKGIKFAENVRVVDSDCAIRLDSVIVDQDVDYAVEVESRSGNNVMLIDPSNFQWTVDDADIASISDEGLLNGKINGRTILKCTLESFNDSILVISEINEPKMSADNFSHAADSWKIKSASAKWNTRFDEADNSRILFNYSASRVPYIQMIRDLRIHSVPDSIAIRFNSSVGMKNVNVSVDYPKSKKPVILTYDKDIKANVDHELIIRASDVVPNPADLIFYPFTLKYIKFNINPSEAAKGDNVIDLNDILLYFNYENISTELDASTLDSFSVWPNPASGTVTVNCVNGSVVEVYDLSGRILMTQFVNDGESLNISSLSAGTYIVKSNNATAKLIIK